MDVLNEFTVSAIIFTLAIVLFIGWFIFAIFGGVGLVALPYDMIEEFKNRPKPITAAELVFDWVDHFKVESLSLATDTPKRKRTLDFKPSF